MSLRENLEKLQSYCIVALRSDIFVFISINMVCSTFFLINLIHGGDNTQSTLSILKQIL